MRIGHLSRSRHPRFLLVALVLILALAACGRTREIKLDASDNGSAVTLGPSDILIITLNANPTTGFAWELYEVDQGVLIPDGLPHFEPGSSATDLTGGSGTQTFRFLPGGTGQTRVTLGYWGPSDPADVLPDQTFTVDVTVEVDD